MNNKQTTFDIFSEDSTSDINLNHDVYNSVDDLEINDDTEQLELDLNTDEIELEGQTPLIRAIDNEMSENNTVKQETNEEVTIEQGETLDMLNDDDIDVITRADIDITDRQQEISEEESELIEELKSEEVKEEINSKPERLVDTQDIESMDELNKDFSNQSDINSKEVQIDLSTSKATGNFGVVKSMALGVGSCGTNTISRLVDQNETDIRLLSVETDQQSLDLSSAPEKLLVGEDIFSGNGTGGNLEGTQKAFENAKEEIKEKLKDVDILFLTGAIGKCTGSVGLSEIGKIAKEMGILSIGFAVLAKKEEVDENILKQYHQEFVDNVDSHIIVENQRAFELFPDLQIKAIMQKVDTLLIDGIRGINDLILTPGKINTDYADIKSAFSHKGAVVMGVGYGKGERLVEDAIEDCLNNEMLDLSNISGAKDVIFNISTPKRNVTIRQAEAGTRLIEQYNEQHTINDVFFGISYDEKLIDQAKVTFIATGTEAKTLEEITSRTNQRANIHRPVTSTTNSTTSSFSQPRKFATNLSDPKDSESKVVIPDFMKKN